MPNFMLGGILFRFIIFIFSRDYLLYNANINNTILLIFSNDDFVMLFLIKYMMMMIKWSSTSTGWGMSTIDSRTLHSLIR